MCCVFRPAFGWCAHPKAGRNTFFSRFQPFYFFQTFFSYFTSEITEKCQIKEKRLKMAKKSVSTNFRVRVASKNLSKNSTIRGPQVLSDISPSALSKITSPTQLCHGPKREMPLNTGRAMPKNILDNVLKTLNQNQAIANTRRAMPLKMIYNLK